MRFVFWMLVGYGLGYLFSWLAFRMQSAAVIDYAERITQYHAQRQ